jgi:hypothetical protein
VQVKVLAPNREATCCLCGQTIMANGIRILIAIGTVTRRMHYSCWTDELKKAEKEFKKEEKHG